MGNEAGDLDSCASAIATSLLSTGFDKPRSVALIQTPRCDLGLRRENLHAFHQFANLKLDHTDLLTIDDITSLIPLQALRSSFTLVDHNRLLPKFASNGDDRVTAIFDHHKDEEKHCKAKPRIIYTTGSCASIIAYYYRCRFPSKPDRVTSEVTSLLLSAIALDTKGVKEVNTDELERGSAYPTDIAACKLLRPLSVFGAISSNSQPPLHDTTIQCLYEDLDRVKRNVCHLSGQALLRRDFKEYNLMSGSGGCVVRYRLSTVPMSVHQWIDRDGAALFWADQSQWINDHGLTFSGILTTFRTPDSDRNHKRELILVFPSKTGHLEQMLYKGIKRNKELKAKVMDVERIGEQHAKAWEVSKKASRKLVAPIIQTIVEKPSEDAELMWADE